MSKVFGTHWKTTLSAICSFLMITGTFISGYLTTQTGLTSWETKLSAACTFFVGLMKVWIGFLQYDAGTTMAIPPGEAVPVPVPAHEVPDNPADQVVVVKGKN